MTWSYQALARKLKPSAMLGAALLITLSTSTWAQPINDVKKWLKEVKEQLEQSDDTLATNERSTNAYTLLQTYIDTRIEPATPATLRHIENDENFAIKYRQIVRANRQHLRRMLKKAVEINLVNTDQYQRRHRVYINTIKRTLVSQHQMGSLHYRLQLSKTQSQLDIRYNFR